MCEKSVIPQGKQFVSGTVFLPGDKQGGTRHWSFISNHAKNHLFCGVFGYFLLALHLVYLVYVLAPCETHSLFCCCFCGWIVWFFLKQSVNQQENQRNTNPFSPPHQFLILQEQIFKRD